MNILVINSGSSSVKYKVINPSNRGIVARGHVDGIGLKSCVFKHGVESDNVFVKDHVEAISLILGKIDKSSIMAVGHRFVHGGSLFFEPVLVDDGVLKKLSSLCDLAPLHNPHNLEGIKACKKLLGVPQIVVFDTSFFKNLPQHASSYALPKEVASKFRIKKFGFHGISHKYLTQSSQDLLGREKVNIISCHLGNGSSVSCIKNNVCIDTSMGFSPLQGLVMGSRSGDIDPSLVVFLQKKLNLTADGVLDLLNNKSGLKGLCGASDMRIVYDRVLEGDEDAFLALDLFCYSVVKYIGAYLASMGGDTHALVFSGGIGEGGFFVRKKVCDSLKHLGVKIDYEKNMFNSGSFSKPAVISDESSKIKVLVIPTNEELMIAHEVVDVLNNV